MIELNNIFIMQNRTSLLYVLFIFYLLKFNSNNHMSNQLDEFLNNKFVQHLLNFTTLFVLITLLNDNIDARDALLYTLIGYIWYILSLKIDLHINLIIILLFAVGYFYDNYTKSYEHELINDKSLSNEQKQNLLNDNTNNKIMLSIIIAIITIIGVVFYTSKKQEQYGGSYDIFVQFLQ